MEILEKRLNDKGKNWRHVYKAFITDIFWNFIKYIYIYLYIHIYFINLFQSLTVLEYLLYHGSEMVVKYIQNNIYIIKTLRDFQYIDENNQDEGINGKYIYIENIYFDFIIVYEFYIN